MLAAKPLVGGSQVTSTESSDLLGNNRRFHKLLTDGVEVEYFFNGEIVHEKVWLTDPSHLLNNDWLAIHPLTVVEGNHAHCPDVVVFINGLPLAVIVSIYPTNEQATFKAGYRRIQTYLQQIPKLFFYNSFLVITCGNQARVGTLTSDWEEFLPWHAIDGEAVAVDGFPGISKLPNPEGEDFPTKGAATELEVLIQGIFDKRRFLEEVLHLIVFESNGTDISKKFLRRPFCTVLNSNKTFRSPPICG
ncbi:type I restriction endonuclease [Dendronalium sp. ChiSLP03b]|uniref:type I restriction endonuclease n=1 Tax=Dendronalium sp. ChiSLP03b TaxID=3075381 RepID=UPI00391CBFDF